MGLSLIALSGSMFAAPGPLVGRARCWEHCYPGQSVTLSSGARILALLSKLKSSHVSEPAIKHLRRSGGFFRALSISDRDIAAPRTCSPDKSGYLYIRQLSNAGDLFGNVSIGHLLQNGCHLSVQLAGTLRSPLEVRGERFSVQRPS